MKTKKRTKAYKPKPISLNAHIVAIKSVKPIDKDDMQKLWQRAFVAINAMQFGRDVTQSDFTSLCDIVNISTILAERGFGREYLEEIRQAKSDLFQLRLRFEQTGKFTMNASWIASIKLAHHVHEHQLKLCTLGDFTKALEEQQRRLTNGEVYGE